MTNTSKTLLFFGNERLVSGLPHTTSPVLRGLIDHGYDIKAVVSHHSDSKSRTKRPLEVAEVAAKHDIPVLLPDRPADIIDQLAGYNAVAAVLVAYGRIIPQRVIDLFPKGIINIHPSLLPKYRGPTPIESAILHGDSQTGVSIMQLTAGMDTGPVYGQATLPLQGNEDKFGVYRSLAQKGTDLLLELLPSILDGSLTPQAQNDNEATYSKLLTKDDSWLHLDALTAAQAERHIRAYLEFPKSKLTIAGHTIVVTKAHTTTEQKTTLDLACKDSLYLSVDTLVAPNGKSMTAEAFINGYLRR